MGEVVEAVREVGEGLFLKLGVMKYRVSDL